MFRALLLTAVLGIAGCATPPDKITGAPTSAAPYLAMSCDELGSAYVTVSSELEPLITTQANARAADVTGVILVGLPVGTMTNPGAEERVKNISRLKGMRDAITSARETKQCA